MHLVSPAWALAAAAAAAEGDDFTDEDSDLDSEEEEDAYDQVGPLNIPGTLCTIPPRKAFSLRGVVAEGGKEGQVFVGDTFPGSCFTVRLVLLSPSNSNSSSLSLKNGASFVEAVRGAVVLMLQFTICSGLDVNTRRTPAGRTYSQLLHQGGVLKIHDVSYIYWPQPAITYESISVK